MSLNILKAAIRTVVQGQTKVDSLTYCKMVWNTSGAGTWSMQVKGIKKGKPIDVTDQNEGDEDAAKLRALFAGRAGKIDGKIDVIEVEVDFLLHRAEQTIFYTSSNNEKKKRTYTL